MATRWLWLGFLAAASAAAACSKSSKQNQSAADSGAVDSGAVDRSASDSSASDSSTSDSATATDVVTADASAGPTFAGVMAAYPTWQRRTPEPVPLSEEIFALCRAPNAAEQKFIESEHGKRRLVLDWLNPAAMTGYADKGKTPFPAGAAIVKEKLVHEASGAVTLVARGMMIKRGPGFDPLHGDWEFAYWEPAAGISTGAAQAQSCGGCHAGAQSTDFVFFDQDWRRP